MTNKDSIRCPICRSVVELGAETCTLCGYSLLVICAGCGKAVGMHDNYCASCGCPLKGELPLTYQDLYQAYQFNLDQMIRYADDLNKLYVQRRRLEQYVPTGLLDKVLVSDEATVGERRYLTVLFSDVVEFTRLSSTMDAEAVFLLMNNCFRLLVEQVRKYGGTIDKFLGDGMMAIFGAPISYGNDAERAVQAALGMQEAMITFNQQMLPKLGRPLDLRIGITSGEAIAGTVGVEEKQSYTVMGSTVNLASRLEGAGNPGSILVNEEVYNHTRDTFTYRVLSPIAVKGFETPVPVYEVVSQLSGRKFGQLPVGHLSPFIGRQAEQKALAQAVDRIAPLRGAAVFVSGDVGLGKTRLMWEWQSRLSTGFQVWSGFAQNYSQLGYDVWQQTILHGLNLQGASRQKVMAVLSDYLGSNTWLAFLEFLLFGEMSDGGRFASLEPEQLKEQIFFAVRRLLRRVSQRQPLVIILDNLQWFDQLSRELLLSVLTLIRSQPILFCISGRPEVSDSEGVAKRAREILGEGTYEIELGPLSTAESEELFRRRFPGMPIPTAVRKYLLERTQNNPYYLEEMISFIANRGLVHQDEDGWHIADIEGLTNLRPPGSLRSLVQAQIDMLPKGEQQILFYAAALGSTFPASLFLFVLGQVPQVSNVATHLASLVERTILTFDGTYYHFVHNIVQESVYHTLLSERRRQIHGQIGAAIELRDGDTTWADVEQLAHHFAAAEKALKAVPYLIEAGHRAQQRFANESALGYFDRALELLPQAPQLTERETEIRKAMGSLYQHIGEYDKALSYYQQSYDQMIERDDRVDCSRLIGRIFGMKGDAQQARHWLEIARIEIEHNPSEITEVVKGRVYVDTGLFYMRQGDAQQAERWCLDAVKALEKTNALGDLARSLNALGGAYYFQQHWRKASEQVERGHKIQQKIGDQMGIALSLSNLGLLYIIDCQWDKATDAFSQAITLCEEIGALEMTLSNAHNNLAFVYIHRGQTDLAEGHLQASLDIKRKIGTTLEVANSLNNLGLSRLVSGDHTAAEVYMKESIELCKTNEEQETLAEATRYLAEVKVAKGDLDEAEILSRQARELARKSGSIVNEGAALRTLAQVFLRQDYLQEARKIANESVELLDSINYTYEVARTRMILAELALTNDDQAGYYHYADLVVSVMSGLKAEPDLKTLQKLNEQARSQFTTVG